jgi:hypothetical protein
MKFRRLSVKDSIRSRLRRRGLNIVLENLCYAEELGGRIIERPHQALVLEDA